MNRTLMLFVAAIAIAIAIVAFPNPEPVHARKIVIDIETPRGPVSGSTVVELKNLRSPWWYPVGGVRSGTVAQGEALHVDLGGGKHLFLLMNDPTHASIRDHLTPDRLEPDGSFKPDEVPLMVTFADIADPRSVRRVRPEDFSAAFGSGYSLRSLRAIGTRDRAAFGSLSTRFPQLYRYFSIPVARRDGDSHTLSRDPLEIRRIDWSAFEDRRW